MMDSPVCPRRWVSDLIATVVLVSDRDWLARRIEIEARAYANADETTRDIRWGRVLGCLEVGSHLGY